MKKRFLSLLLALVMCMGLTIPAQAATVQTKAGANLTAAEQKIYEALETAVIEVAEGKRENGKITIDFEPGELTWTAQELGLSSIDDDNAFVVDEKAGELIEGLWYCLKLNLPFEMFWANNSWRWFTYEEHTDSSVWVTRLDCWLEALPAYRGGDDIEYDLDTVDPDKIALGRAAAENAKAIVKANEGKSDYEKLTAYRDAICSLTSYNFDAEAENEKSGYQSYGNPWQLVYVFDNDPSTNVLCEGYSKAFKYLCDLSEFNGDVTCYIAEGHMDGGGHMWNVVRMGDGNFYLVDVTNSDTGMTGERGGLFLTGASGSGRTYVVSHNGWKCTYVYREDNKDQYTDGYLPISTDDYSPDNDVPAPSFTDLKVWCEKEAIWAAQQGITNGYGVKDKFAPSVDCTQVQILTFLWRAAGKPISKETTFSALPGDYAPAANWAYEQGMIDTSIAPNAPCKRADAVSYIWQALDKPKAEKTASFSDVDADAAYINAVSWAVEKGITKGYGSSDTFAPDRVCNRGEIVCFLYRAYNK